MRPILPVSPPAGADPAPRSGGEVVALCRRLRSLRNLQACLPAGLADHLIEDRAGALIMLASTAQATTVGDALAQLVLALDEAEAIGDGSMPAPEFTSECGLKLWRLLASAVPLLARACGVALEDMFDRAALERQFAGMMDVDAMASDGAWTVWLQKAEGRDTGEQDGGALAEGQGADAELLKLVAAFHANRAESKVLVDRVQDLPPTDARYKTAWEKQASELSPRFHELKWKIAVTPARTPEGLRAKATAALTMVCPELDGAPSDDDALSASVLHDVLGLPQIRRDEENGGDA